MNISKALVGLAIGLSVAACAKNTTDEYLTGTRCKQGTEVVFTTFMAMSCGNGCVTNIPIVQTTCSYESYTYANPDYIGPAQR